MKDARNWIETAALASAYSDERRKASASLSCDEHENRGK